MVEQIWHRYSDKLFNFLNRRIGDEEIARDLLQDTFQKILLNRDRLKEVENREAWLMSVARNTLIDYTRKKREFSADEPAVAETGDAESGKERLVEEISECLYELIEEYGSEEQELLLNIFTKSMTQKEMARYLGIPYSTLKSRVQKARDHISQEFRTRCCTLKRNSDGAIIGCTPVRKCLSAGC